jgi:hypothetical protein
LVEVQEFEEPAKSEGAEPEALAEAEAEEEEQKDSEK